MRGRYRGGRSRGGYGGERRWQGQSGQGARRGEGYQRGQPEQGWGDEREWDNMGGERGSMHGYQGQSQEYRSRSDFQGGYDSQGRYQGPDSQAYQGRPGQGRGGYQGGYQRGYQEGYGGSPQGYQGGQSDESDYEEGEYQGGYSQGESGSQGGYGRQGRWGSSRSERSFPGSSSFGGGSGGYGRGYEGEESGRDGESGSYGQSGRSGMGMSGSGQQHGPHSGRGPKGYQRSDERIREDVSEALSRHGHVDASEITVEVRGGEVTLTGTVDSRDAKREAERAIENEPGVKEVQNQLRVQEKKKAESQYQGSESATSHRSGVPSADQQSESRGRSRSSSSLGANV